MASFQSGGISALWSERLKSLVKGAAMMGAAVLIKNAGRSSDPADFLGSRADSFWRDLFPLEH